MPISDIFPDAGITFWDVAHETNGGLIADGYTRATGKMSMVIAQNGPGPIPAISIIFFPSKGPILYPSQDWQALSLLGKTFALFDEHRNHNRLHHTQQTV